MFFLSALVGGSTDGHWKSFHPINQQNKCQWHFVLYGATLVDDDAFILAVGVNIRRNGSKDIEYYDTGIQSTRPVRKLHLPE